MNSSRNFFVSLYSKNRNNYHQVNTLMNNQTTAKQKTPSVYRAGAEDGWRLGLYMMAIFLCGAYSMQVPVLGILSFILTLVIPVITFIWLKRDYVRYPGLRFFSAIWMHGIAMFFFGGLLLALCVYLFLRFFQPDFIVDNVRMAIDMYRSMKDVPGSEDLAHTLEQMLEQHLLPSAINVAMTMIWLSTFFGSVMSLLFSVIIRFFIRINDQSNI